MEGDILVKNNFLQQKKEKETKRVIGKATLEVVTNSTGKYVSMELTLSNERYSLWKPVDGNLPTRSLKNKLKEMYYEIRHIIMEL